MEDDRVEAKKSMLDAYPSLRKMYDENDGNTQVFYFKNATATFSSFSENIFDQNQLESDIKQLLTDDDVAKQNRRL